MKLPRNDIRRLELVQEIRETCLASRQSRMNRYVTFRNYFLHGMADGGKSAWNQVYPSLDLLTSFLYAADTTKFSVELSSGTSRVDYGRTDALAKRIHEKWSASNADLVFGDCLTWSLVYDSTFMKLIRRKGSIHPFMVDPGSFGVYREDVPMLDRQDAFIHVYYMTLPELDRALALHPRRDSIMKKVIASKTKKDIAQEAPPLIERVSMSAITPNLIGEASVNLNASPDYRAEISADLVEMGEIWAWDDDQDDYQIITMASDLDIIYDRPNFFMPRSRRWEGEHCFVQVCPNPLPDYFWGQSEIDRLAPLQDKLNKRMDDVERLLSKQVDPPSAWTGQGIIEEKLEALNYPGSQVGIGADPTIKKHEFKPDVPLDVYRDVEKIEAQFMLAMGLSNVLLGRGESGVRSAGHANKLANLGGARPKKRALIIEGSLDKISTLYGRILYQDDDSILLDDKGVAFTIAQMDPDFTCTVDGHSNSPVFMDNQRENAAILFKARAINRRRLIEMIGPPKQEELIRDLEEKIIPAEQAAARAEQEAIAQGNAAKLKSVK